MNKNIAKGSEECLSQDCQDCEFGGQFMMCNERMNQNYKKNLEQMIDCCKSLDAKEKDFSNSNKIITVIFTFFCMGIISHKEAEDYFNRLSPEEVK